MKIKTQILQKETPPLQRAILDLIILQSSKKKKLTGNKRIKSPIKKRGDK